MNIYISQKNKKIIQEIEKKYNISFNNLLGITKEIKTKLGTKIKFEGG